MLNQTKALMHPRFWRPKPQAYGFVSFLDTHNKAVILKVHSCVCDTTADTAGLYSFKARGTVGVCNSLYLLVSSHNGSQSKSLHPRFQNWNANPLRNLSCISFKLVCKNNEQLALVMMDCCLDERLVDISSSPFGSWRKEKKST